MNVYLKYLGGGHLTGVPARDLTKEEANDFNISVLLSSGLYGKVDMKKKPKASRNKAAYGGSENK